MTNFIYLTRRQILMYRMKQHRPEDYIVGGTLVAIAILILFGVI